MSERLVRMLKKEMANLEAAGLSKKELTVDTPHRIDLELGERSNIANYSSTNYLGLAGSETLKAAAEEALHRYGYGVTSTRMILGTQPVHHDLEEKLAAFVGTEQAMVFNCDYSANIGLFETFADERDTIFCDSQAHASIIDGIRLSKANPVRYDNNDMDDLEYHLKKSKQSRLRIIVTDGVFETNGTSAKLEQISELAKNYKAMIVLNDAQATGVMGEKGRGTHEHCDVLENIDIITGTFNHALGGINGGFVAGRADIIQWLKQRSRPYILSHALSPINAAVALKALEMIEGDPSLLGQLRERLDVVFQGLKKGMYVPMSPAAHPIISILTHDAVTTQKVADHLLAQGIFATGLCYPSVPRNEARIRLMITNEHSVEQLQQLVETLSSVDTRDMIEEPPAEGEDQ